MTGEKAPADGSGGTRKRFGGAAPGNQNALVHGMYGREFTAVRNEVKQFLRTLDEGQSWVDLKRAEALGLYLFRVIRSALKAHKLGQSENMAEVTRAISAWQNLADAKMRWRDRLRGLTKNDPAVLPILEADFQVEREGAAEIKQTGRALREMLNPPKAPDLGKSATSPAVGEAQEPKARTDGSEVAGGGRGEPGDGALGKRGEIRGGAGNPGIPPVVPDYSDLLGKAYRFGGRGPDEFDCTGLVLEIYHRAGLPLADPVIDPDLAEEQTEEAADKRHPQPMDILSFPNKDGFGTHVGVSIDGDKFLHSMQGIGVIETRWDQTFLRTVEVRRWRTA